VARLGPVATGGVRRLTAACIAVGLAAAVAAAAAPAASVPLRVGVSNTPPFAIHHSDRSWSGIAVDLWSTVAAELGHPFVFEVREPAGLLQGVRDGSLDVVVGPIAITPSRAEVADFTAPYFSTTLSVAVRPQTALGWGQLLAVVFSPRLLNALLAMALVAIVLALAVWMVEHRGNPDHFEGHPRRGLWSAVWWAASTITTVGYGDKTPRSVPGRLVAIVGMVLGILLASVLTATFASELTLRHLRATVRGPDDLRQVTVGAVADSTAEAWLTGHGIGSRVYPDVLEALDALERGKVEAVVHFDAVLRYAAQSSLRGKLEVLQVALQPEFLAFALPPRSDLRDPINRALVRAISADRWPHLLESYLGRL